MLKKSSFWARQTRSSVTYHSSPFATPSASLHTLGIISSDAENNQFSSSVVPPVKTPPAQILTLPLPPLQKLYQIPLLIHQTYKTNTPFSSPQVSLSPPERLQWFESWKLQNPIAHYKIWNDDEADWFMQTHFGGEGGGSDLGNRVYKAYLKMELMVMKTDLLRYALLYVYGGFYADADTTCLQSIEKWDGGINLSSGLGKNALSSPEHLLIVGVEWYPNYFSHVNSEDYYKRLQLLQWTFAASPKHPALFALLQEISNDVLNSTREYLSDRTNVEAVGGPQVFTKAVAQYMSQYGDALEASFSNEDAATSTRSKWFETSRVLVHPMYAYNARSSPSRTKWWRWLRDGLLKRRIGKFDFVDHHYWGASKQGWKFT
ncbi:hypothetical protein BDR26DRAFT_938922 [Obelidium mucronatum]|nr:hypothetical protein BDR26DRAFT_938922 [Obelidium mucronatum]